MPPARTDNDPMNPCLEALAGILLAMDNAGRSAGRPRPAQLLAVSKTRAATEVAELAEEFREDCSFPFAILPYSE